MSKYSNLLFETGTPQSQPLTATEAKQVQNSAGGFVFSLSPFKRLERFLILGSDSNTYYSSAQKLTKENAACVTECWTDDPIRTQQTIINISREGRAPKNSPAIFALALGMIHPDTLTRQCARGAVPHVCRTSTHLFEFVDTCDKLGKGWGRIMKSAVADWYNTKDDAALAYQLVKYRQRESYTHERLIRLSHPKQTITSPERSAMYDWLRGRDTTGRPLPGIIMAHREAMTTNSVEAIVTLLSYYDLPWEALPTEANSKKEVWQAMLANRMPLNAMIRNLGNMTRLGVFGDPGRIIDAAYMTNVIERIESENELKRARIHPFNLLTALKTYSSGKGFHGSNTWTPWSSIEQALETAFYKSFRFIQPSNKRIMLALDVSGSMNNSMNNSPLTVREASSAMAMSTLAVEEHAFVTGFTSLQHHNYGHGAISPLNIKRGMSLTEVCQYTDRLPFSGTDCALPMLYAMEEKISVDAFVIYTDSETWAGRIHSVEALKRYREMSGIDAKLVVVGMTSTNFTIADPNDPGMLDVVGFDSSAPSIIASFLYDKHALLEDNTSAISDDVENGKEEI